MSTRRRGPEQIVLRGLSVSGFAPPETSRESSSRFVCCSYLNNRVYVSLANGDICIYRPDTSKRDDILNVDSPKRPAGTYLITDGSWNTSDPVTINVGSAAVPVSKMLPVGDKLWCSCHNAVKIFDTVALQFQVSKTRSSANAGTGLVRTGLGGWAPRSPSSAEHAVFDSADVAPAPRRFRRVSARRSSPCPCGTPTSVKIGRTFALRAKSRNACRIANTGRQNSVLSYDMARSTFLNPYV